MLAHGGYRDEREDDHIGLVEFGTETGMTPPGLSGAIGRISSIAGKRRITVSLVKAPDTFLAGHGIRTVSLTIRHTTTVART